jgi:hypothetical protein
VALFSNSAISEVQRGNEQCLVLGLQPSGPDPGSSRLEPLWYNIKKSLSWFACDRKTRLAYPRLMAHTASLNRAYIEPATVRPNFSLSTSTLDGSANALSSPFAYTVSICLPPLRTPVRRPPLRGSVRNRRPLLRVDMPAIGQAGCPRVHGDAPRPPDTCRLSLSFHLRNRAHAAAFRQNASIRSLPTQLVLPIGHLHIQPRRTVHTCPCWVVQIAGFEPGNRC